MTTAPVTRLHHRLHHSPHGRRDNETGSTTAEYAAVTAAGCGFAGVLIALLQSDFGMDLLKMLVDFFLKMIGIG